MRAPPVGWPDPKPGPLIKICGLNDPLVAFQAMRAGADLIGVVYFEPSPRHVGPGVAKDVAEAVRGGTSIVLLTVDATDRELDTLVQRITPDALQLHGRETPERVSMLAARYDLPVAKAIGVSGADDLAKADAYVEALLVLDAKPPEGADRPGGHGATFDWSLTSALNGRPAMLSGGLTPQNVPSAIAAARPYAVDVSSGVESTPGRKDPKLISAFINAVRPVAGG